ncbi:HEPN/Toprim-associated domain-containing protein [Streptomyces sp. NPDC092903]|uniref:HEPN/Toprim-associated domain-containing protein n=1 Tax=Streptomyces sp. NPDC092903 TaxID=3366017 RepID=UPI0037FF5247
MGHYSYLEIGTAKALLCRESYYPDVAALFVESDCYRRKESDEDWGNEGQYGYETSIREMSQRLEMLGITPSVALADLAKGLSKWKERPVGGEGPQNPELAPPDIEKVERDLRFYLSFDPETLCFSDLDFHSKFERGSASGVLVDYLHWHMDTRSLVRLLLHWAPDQNARIALDLSELTGCCVELDPMKPYARQARAEQLLVATTNLPLVVITEGSTDARLLSEGMKVTHPHLVGFIRFFDYGVGSRPRGGADAVAEVFKAFVAAGIGNRFVAIADNDAAAHEKLLALKNNRWPPQCRILHYPALPLLQAYPTYDPATGTSTPADVNVQAGSLEMYLGQDTLTDTNGDLMPVHWKAVQPKTGLRQGALREPDKKAAQKRFEAKLKAARSGQPVGTEDWSGISAIIDSIVRAFQ